MKILGTVTDAIGLTDYEGQEKAGKNAAASQAQANALSREQIAFMREQYSDFKDIYGPIEDNLSEYFKSLNPEKVAAMGLENQQREFEVARATIEQDSARRGISGSGIETGNKVNATFMNAEQRARIRSGADKAVADEKMGFLGLGLGQGANMLGNINAAYATGVASNTNLAASSMSQYTSLSNKNTDAMGQVIGVGAGYASGRPGTNAFLAGGN